MSDKRRRRTGGSEDSEHSDSEAGEEKIGDQDLEKDEGVVSEILCHVETFEPSGTEYRSFGQYHHALPPGPALPSHTCPLERKLILGLTNCKPLPTKRFSNTVRITCQVNYE